MLVDQTWPPALTPDSFFPNTQTFSDRIDARLSFKPNSHSMRLYDLPAMRIGLNLRGSGNNAWGKILGRFRVNIFLGAR